MFMEVLISSLAALSCGFHLLLVPENWSTYDSTMKPFHYVLEPGTALCDVAYDSIHPSHGRPGHLLGYLSPTHAFCLLSHSPLQESKAVADNAEVNL